MAVLEVVDVGVRFGGVVALDSLSFTIDAGQKITMSAGMEILLKVGSNSVKIDQSGVTIKGTVVKIEGAAMFEAKSPMSTVKGDGLLTLKGGITMIN